MISCKYVERENVQFPPSSSGRSIFIKNVSVELVISPWWRLPTNSLVLSKTLLLPFPTLPALSRSCCSYRFVELEKPSILNCWPGVTSGDQPPMKPLNSSSLGPGSFLGKQVQTWILSIACLITPNHYYNYLMDHRGNQSEFSWVIKVGLLVIITSEGDAM